MFLTCPLIDQAIALKTPQPRTKRHPFCNVQPTSVVPNAAAVEAVDMGKHRIKPNYRRRVLRLPDVDHCKLAVLNSLGSPASRRVYEYAINQQLAAVRRLAHEAADSGLLSPELAAGISRVKGVKQLGFRSGNWLSAE